MARPLNLAMIAASVIALAVLLGVLALRDKTPSPAAVEVPDPTEELAPPDPGTPEAVRSAPPLTEAVAARVAPPPAQPVAAKPLDETSLLARLHELAASDPPLSLKLAQEAVSRFPDSPNAPEFEWHVVKSLFNLERIEEAREEAVNMLWKYPGNEFTNDVDHHLLNHPPNPSDLEH